MHYDEPAGLVSRYVALWNEPDAGLRRKAIGELWAEDGSQILQPPEEIREAASRVGFGAPALEACGHDALETRVTRAYEEFVATGEFRFQSRGNAARLGSIVTFHWDMVRAADGQPAGGGLEILVLAGDGRISSDYQFIGG